jgi:hypothetical protein
MCQAKVRGCRRASGAGPDGTGLGPRPRRWSLCRGSSGESPSHSCGDCRQRRPAAGIALNCRAQHLEMGLTDLARDQQRHGHPLGVIVPGGEPIWPSPRHRQPAVARGIMLQESAKARHLNAHIDLPRPPVTRACRRMDGCSSPFAPSIIPRDKTPDGVLCLGGRGGMAVGDSGQRGEG